jgi:hypothetical protein
LPLQRRKAPATPAGPNLEAHQPSDLVVASDPSPQASHGPAGASPDRPILASRPLSLSSVQRAFRDTTSSAPTGNRSGQAAARERAGVPAPPTATAARSAPAVNGAFAHPFAPGSPAAVQRQVPGLATLAPPSRPGLPSLPSAPSLPAPLDLPVRPGLPSVPGLPAVQRLPGPADLPTGGLPDAGGLAGSTLGAASSAVPRLAVQALDVSGPADQVADAATGALGDAASALGGAMGSEQLEELAKGLYDKIRQRLKAELRLDRERYGRVTDLAR